MSWTDEPDDLHKCKAAQSIRYRLNNSKLQTLYLFTVADVSIKKQVSVLQQLRKDHWDKEKTRYQGLFGR